VFKMLYPAADKRNGISMHDPNDRIVKSIRRKKIVWLLWALSLLLILLGLLVPYTAHKEAGPIGSIERKELSWNPLVEKSTVREHYLQTRQIGYAADGRRIDEKVYICTA